MGYIKDPVIVTTQRLVHSNPNFKIDYPVVTGVDQPHIQQEINYKILELVYQLIKDQTSTWTREGEVLPIETMLGWYEIKSNERGILSISLGNYTYPYHAAHGTTVIQSLTFNSITGQLYKLGDLFEPDSDYVKVLSDIIQQQIKDRDINLLDEFKGIREDQDFYIADKCLVIYFQLYEIAAYVYGILYFPISVYDIQEITKEGSPLAIMSYA